MDNHLKSQHPPFQENPPSTNGQTIGNRPNTLYKKHHIAAYLFWKIQSHLTKLANQLRLKKLKTAATADPKLPPHKD
jgi:hypothetical protein